MWPCIMLWAVMVGVCCAAAMLPPVAPLPPSSVALDVLLCKALSEKTDRSGPEVDVDMVPGKFRAGSELLATGKLPPLRVPAGEKRNESSTCPSGLCWRFHATAPRTTAWRWEDVDPRQLRFPRHGFAVGLAAGGCTAGGYTAESGGPAPAGNFGGTLSSPKP